MKLFNIVKSFTERIDRLIKGEQVESKPFFVETVEYQDIVTRTVKAKSNLEINIDRLKSIYANTKKFRVKKKLDKRILKLEDISLIRVREM